MNLQQHLEELIFRSPGLFGNRTQALHFLYASWGSGLQWLNGEIVSETEDHQDDTVQPPGRASRAIDRAEAAKRAQTAGPLIDSQLPRIKALQRAHAIEIQQSMMSMNESSMLACIPEDATEDYLQGAREFIDCILEIDGRVAGNPIWTINEKHTANNMLIANNALQTIENMR